LEGSANMDEMKQDDAPFDMFAFSYPDGFDCGKK
jgi:hypothetical protein